MSYQPYKAYSRATHTVAKTRQVVMLYDGVIRFLSHAREAMEQGEIERRFKSLTRAGEIIAGLQSCLDFEAGGQTAQTLFDFYSAIEMRILQLHRTADAVECQNLITELKSMREVWNTIDAGTTPPSSPPSHGRGDDHAQPMTFSA